MNEARRTNKLWILGALVASLTCLDIVTAFSGDRVNVRGMGMARASVASSRGLDAVGINPANLSFPEEVMSFTVLPAGAFFSSDFFSYELYSKYLMNRSVLPDLPDADKQAILNSFGSPTGSLRAQADVRLFGITLRPNLHSTIAFTVDYGLNAGATIPREYARLLLYGNTPGSSFDVNGLTIDAWWGRSYTLSYGERLPTPDFLKWLAGGVSVKLIQGYGYYGVEQFKASARTGSDGLLTAALAWKARRTNANTFSQPMENLFQNPAGYGVGLDFGIAGGLDENISFGISVTNIGRIRWTQDVEEFTFDSTVTSDNPDVFKRARSLADSAHGGHRTTNPFSTTLPAIIRLGFSAQLTRDGGWDFLPGEMVVAAEYLQGIGSDLPLSERQRVLFGVEYKPVRWLPLRSGVSFGEGTARIALGFGLSFRFFNFDLATEDILWFFNRSILTGSIGMAMRFRIPE